MQSSGATARSSFVLKDIALVLCTLNFVGDDFHLHSCACASDCTDNERLILAVVTVSMNVGAVNIHMCSCSYIIECTGNEFYYSSWPCVNDV